MDGGKVFLSSHDSKQRGRRHGIARARSQAAGTRKNADLPLTTQRKKAGDGAHGPCYGPRAANSCPEKVGATGGPSLPCRVSPTACRAAKSRRQLHRTTPIDRPTDTGAQKSRLRQLHCYRTAPRPPARTSPSIRAHRSMPNIFQAFPQLRTAAPRLSRRLFASRPCLNSTARALPIRATPHPQSVLKQVRWKSTQPLRSNATAQAPSPIAEAAAKSAPKNKTSSWPETSSKSVAYWLLGSAASVFGIVIFGGLTRLTESG